MDEIKLFSEALEKGKVTDIIRKTSVSDQDYANRMEVYSKVFSTYVDLKESMKTFSGITEMPILNNQFFNATLAGWARSFRGFLTIERSMDQPTALLGFLDLIGVTDNRKVLPNYGKEDLNGLGSSFSTEGMLNDRKNYKISTAKKLIPGSVRIALFSKDSQEPIMIRDDKRGNLLAPAGILAGTDLKGVEYNNGVINFSISDTADFANGKYMIKAVEDVAGTPAYGELAGPGANRFKLQMHNIIVATEPDMLIGENNLLAIASMRKSTSIDPATAMGTKLTELYTKLINRKLVMDLKGMNEGDDLVIDVTRNKISYTDFTSYLNYLSSRLIEVDTALAKKSYKGIQATAYVVGEKVGNWFMKLAMTGQFVPNTDSTYVNDLLGYYMGRPVLRHLDLDDNEGYAVHKTADGQLAPLMSGIYLPLTATPAVGNYNNPTQYASGVYYQEANKGIVPELMVRFRIIDNEERIGFDVYQH